MKRSSPSSSRPSFRPSFLGCAIALVLAAVTLVACQDDEGTPAVSSVDPDAAKVEANKQVVLNYLQDIFNGHHGDHAGMYLRTGAFKAPWIR